MVQEAGCRALGALTRMGAGLPHVMPGARVGFHLKRILCFERRCGSKVHPARAAGEWVGCCIQQALRKCLRGGCGQPPTRASLGGASPVRIRNGHGTPTGLSAGHHGDSGQRAARKWWELNPREPDGRVRTDGRPQNLGSLGAPDGAAPQDHTCRCAAAWRTRREGP